MIIGIEQPQFKFNYLAVVGNSGTGKTTLVKQILNSLKWDSLFLCDPNRQYADYTINDNATYLSPSELHDALNRIGKKLLLQGKTGVLVIEDLGLTIQRITETLSVTEKKAKQLIALLLDNFRKYDVKVIVISQDVDKDLIGKFDTKVFFQTPLNQYQVKKYGHDLDLNLNDVPMLPRFNYLLKSQEKIERGIVQPLESHQAIEKDKGFMVKEILAKCRSLPEKVLVLRLHLGLSNPEIAEKLSIQTDTVKEIVSRLRKRGLPIPDARKTFRLENLAF